MKKFDYDKFLNTNSKVAVLCRTSKEAEEFGKQMNIRHQHTALNRPYNENYKNCDKYIGIIFTNDGRYGLLHEFSLLHEYNVYDFTTGKVIDWRRGTKRPNDYYLHKDVVDYKDYVFENQLYRVIYSKTYNHHYSKYAEYPSYQIEGYIDNFNPADKIAIRDKNNLLYCIDYKLIILIEPIKEDKK